METKIQIKSILGDVLFEYSKEDNMIKDTLHKAVLSGVNLYGADLRGADLRGADLYGANLYESDLYESDLSGVNLRGADLYRADLREADLRGADLRGADLRGANLCGANLCGADLRGANLDIINYDESTSFLLPQCPEYGSFIGYKKASNHIVKLLIPEDAKRSSATTLKCRCSKAKVLEIQNLDGSISDLKAVPSDRNKNFIYVVGEEKEVKNFDDDRWNECSTGIHFFISREMAVKYVK